MNRDECLVYVHIYQTLLHSAACMNANSMLRWTGWMSRAASACLSELVYLWRGDQHYSIASGFCSVHAPHLNEHPRKPQGWCLYLLKTSQDRGLERHLLYKHMSHKYDCDRYSSAEWLWTSWCGEDHNFFNVFFKNFKFVYDFIYLFIQNFQCHRYIMIARNPLPKTDTHTVVFSCLKGTITKQQCEIQREALDSVAVHRYKPLMSLWFKLVQIQMKQCWHSQKHWRRNWRSIVPQQSS